MSTLEMADPQPGPDASQRMVTAALAGAGSPAEPAPGPQAAPTPSAAAAPSGPANALDRDALVPPAAVAAKPAAVAAKPAAVAAKPAAVAVDSGERGAARSRDAVWAAVAGALCGAVLAILAVAIFGRALGLAGRAEVAALSRNLDTVQRNSEAIVERVDAFDGSLLALRGDLAATSTDLGALRTDLDAATADVALARLAVTDLEERTGTTVGTLEAQLARAEGTLDGVATSLETTNERMTEYDAVLVAMGDLLVGLRPPAE